MVRRAKRAYAPMWSESLLRLQGICHHARGRTQGGRSLLLVNVLANPRPAVVTYKYAMAGEEHVPQAELYTYRRGDATVMPLSVAKWKDQKLSDLQFTTGSDKLRLVRQARTYRELEYIEVNLQTKAITPLILRVVRQGPRAAVQGARAISRGGATSSGRRSGPAGRTTTSTITLASSRTRSPPASGAPSESSSSIQ